MSSTNLSSHFRIPRKAKFWKTRRAIISGQDPTYKVIYLGNVLTGWAKGDGCINKPLNTLWRNHLSSDKADILMKISVSGSGLRAVTKEHGLTEYWANRITFCISDESFPKVFCWIYRHDGRKMKQELRCHAVLCSSEAKARQMAVRLKERIHQALMDFKREKISRQNARLSLANSAYENPSMPVRKILLQTGSSNYRPPIERSKTAPKLRAIEEVLLEEYDDDDEEYREEEEEEDEMTLATETPNAIISDPISAPGETRLTEVDNSDSEDEITDHLASDYKRPLSSSSSPSTTSRSLNSPTTEEELTDEFVKMAVDQDTISDESGYAEDAPLCCQNENNDDARSSSDDEAEEDTDRRLDYSVKGIDRRDDLRANLKLYQNKLIPEFCIHI